MKALLERFARYNRWMNSRLYDAAARLSDEARRADRGAFFGSIHGTLNHLLLGDRLWLTHWADQGFIEPLPEDLRLPDVDHLGQPLYATFEEMCIARDQLDERILEAVRGWDDEALARDSVEHWPDGRTIRRPLWHDVQHLFNHQTHHRGQVTALLMQAGIDPGITDIVALPADA